MLSADALIRTLALKPHPEGGHYRETFRDRGGPDGRPLSTAILFLLRAGERSAWHRVDAVEVWHFHAGASLRLRLAPEDRAPESVRLGADILSGERPQAVVPAGVWQEAESLGAWTLVGCTVAPGFRFEGFELAPAGFDPLAMKDCP